MGGCATKPLVTEETDSIKPVEKTTGAAEPAKADEAGSGEEQQEPVRSEEAEGQKSLCNHLKEKEAEETAAADGEERRTEEIEKVSNEEAESKPEASEDSAEAATVEEKQQ